MSTKGYGVYIVEPGKVEVREMDVSDPRPDEVQVRCVANGICMGEVSQFRGVEGRGGPHLAGHEGIGFVTKVGSEIEGVSEGDAVACTKWASLSNYKLTVREYGYLRPARYAAPPDDPAVYIAEPASCVVSALYHYEITPGDRVLLMGAGYMGLLNVQGLAHCPLGELIVTDVKPRNLELAREFGATDVIQVGTPVGDAKLESLKERLFDLVVEAAGAEAPLQSAGSYLRTGGRLSIFAWHHEPRAVDFGLWHMRGLRVLNAAPMISTDHNVDNMARAVRLLENGVFDQRKLVTHRHPVSQAQEAMELASERPPEYIKGVLLFD